jgi:hypothetical protein
MNTSGSLRSRCIVQTSKGGGGGGRSVRFAGNPQILCTFCGEAVRGTQHYSAPAVATLERGKRSKRVVAFQRGTGNCATHFDGALQCHFSAHSSIGIHSPAQYTPCEAIQSQQLQLNISPPTCFRAMTVVFHSKSGHTWTLPSAGLAGRENPAWTTKPGRRAQAWWENLPCRRGREVVASL